MLPQPTVSEDAASKDQSSLPFSLTYALRLTELGYESTASGGGEEEGEEPATSVQQQQQTTERSLFVPDDMPVDLRVKLALAMINLGRKLPEVRLIIHFCLQLCVFYCCACVCVTFSTTVETSRTDFF